MILSINWSFDAEIIEGWRTPNWYGLLFVTGLILGYFVVRRVFKREGIQESVLDKLVLYMVIATIVGARLGHVLFYGPYWGPNGYFSNPGEIFKIWEGGLASHGGAFAILIALYWFSKKVAKRPMIWILDRIVAPIAIAGVFIRLGNLVNHEIVGNITEVPWGFKFLYNDCAYPYTCPWDEIPARHPSQLYESLSYLFIFAVLMFMYWKREAWKRPGLLFGTFLILLFGARFLVEFTKVAQVDDRAGWALNTGQLLSIPFVLVGIVILWSAMKKEPLKSLEPEKTSQPEE